MVSTKKRERSNKIPFFFILLFFWSATLIYAETPPIHVGGTVLDEQGRPISDVTVMLNAPDVSSGVLHKTLTDENGRFEIDLSDLVWSREIFFYVYSLIAISQEIDPEKKSIGIFVRKPFANEKQDETNIEIKMEPAVTIRGRVLNTEEQPIPDAQVDFGLFYSTGLPEMITDIDGHFQGVAPRSYFSEAKSMSRMGKKWRVFKDGFAMLFEQTELVPQSTTEIPPLTFRLSETRKKAVFRAVDQQGRPKKNVIFSFSHFTASSPSSSPEFFLVNLKRCADEEGRVEFDLVPDWISTPIRFYVLGTDGWSPKKQPIFHPEKDADKEITVEMLTPVSLSGTILKENGEPLSETRILISSLQSENFFFRQETQTDAEGKFSLPVSPNQVYGPPTIMKPTSEKFQIFASENDEHIVESGKPVSNFNFTARKVVAVNCNFCFPDDYTENSAQGTFIRDSDNRLWLSVYFFAGAIQPDSFSSVTQQKTAIDTQGNELTYWKSPYFHQASFPDDKSQPGRFTVYLPSGTFTVTGNVETKTFEVKTDGTEVVLDLTVKAAQESIKIARVEAGNRKTITGRVVRRIDDEMVPVSEIIVENENGIQTTSGGDGTFTFECADYYDDVAVYVRTKDYSEVGFTRATEQDGPVEIELKPVASLKGRLVDSQTGNPIADSKIECTGPTQMHERIITAPYFKEARSDKHGRISMTGFVPGLLYQIQCEPAENPDKGTSAILGFFVAPEPGEFEAGDIAVFDIRSGNQMADCVMQPFRQEGSAKERFEAAKRRSKETKKPLLLFFTETAIDEDNEAFTMWVFQTVFGIQGRKYLSGFEYIAVDLCPELQEKTKANELLDVLKVEAPDENEFLVCIVDPDGTLVTKRNAADFRAPSFGSDGELQLEFDSVLLLTFLREFGK